MDEPSHQSSTRRARRSFWVLVLVAVAATGSLSDALAAPPGHGTAIRVALSGLTSVVAVCLAARILIAGERARRQR